MPSSITEQVRALRRSRVGIGVLASYANTGTSFLCNFLVVPIYLKYLGRDDYGLWITVSGLVAYLALLNLGIAQTTANRLGEAVARNERERQSHILSTGFWFFTGVALTPQLAAVLAGPWLPWHLLVKGQTQLSDTAKLVLIVLPTTFLLELPLTLFRLLAEYWEDSFAAGCRPVAVLPVLSSRSAPRTSSAISGHMLSCGN